MTALLKSSCPQVLTWFDDIRTILVCDFLTNWPTLESAQKVKLKTLEKFFREHHAVRTEANEERIALIKEAVPLTSDKAVINSSVLLVKALAAQMKMTIEAITEFDREITTLCHSHQDYHLFDALPGAGEVYSSRLLAALGTNRARWTTADELLCFSRIAPVVERSGKSQWIRWRYFCPKFLRPIFYRVRRRVDQALLLGESLLQCTASEGEESSSGGACLSLQMDPDHLSVLADQHTV